MYKRLIILFMFLPCIASCDNTEKQDTPNDDKVSILGTWRSFLLEVLNIYTYELEERMTTYEMKVIFSNTEAIFISDELLSYSELPINPDGKLVCSWKYDNQNPEIIVFPELASSHGFIILATLSGSTLSLQMRSKYDDSWNLYSCFKVK